MQKIIIKNKKIKIISILNCLFNKKVLRFTYLGICRLNKMPEYNFNLYEFNVMLQDFSNYTVFIKKISKESIKENLFCYWQFCEENYNMHGNFYLHKASLRNEILNNNLEYVHKYTLQLLSKNKKIWKASDINIVDTDKMNTQMNFNNLHKNSNDSYERYSKGVKNNTKEYLFIGII